MNDNTPGSKTVNITPATPGAVSMSPTPKLSQNRESLTQQRTNPLLKTKTMKSRIKRHDSMFSAKRAVLQDLEQLEKKMTLRNKLS